MSSRALKKLQGESGPGLDIKDKEQSDQEGESGAKKKQLNINRYDLLNQQSQSESEVKEDDNETEHASATSNISTSNISKKKKKKRKKKSTKYSGHQISSEDNEINDKLFYEIDRFFGKASKPPKPTVSDVTQEIGKSLLCVELKNLNPQYEMRRTFGKKVVKIENKRTRGQKPSLKSTYLVTPKDTFPPISKDIISMKICSPPENVKPIKDVLWFCFEHSKFYQTIQNMFLAAVERMDSDFLVKIIKRCPYHVDALIQMSELCKMAENHSMASGLIERALLILETSLHPSFSLTSGNSRLDYKRQENRSFFIVLFKHAQYLEGRACCRTAFEISKLILSLDSDTDPLAVILIIDYYALRSKQYNWLIKFYNEWEYSKSLSQLPNMAYSYALSLFFIKSGDDSEEADKALQYALLMFPGVLKPLLEEMSVQTDKRVISHSYFNSGISGSQSPALHQLICLYVCRAKILWRDSSILPWLERNVNLVLDKVDKGDEIVDEYSSKRSLRYINPPRAILRHVILSDYKEKVPLARFLTKEKEPIMMYDPLPPLDSINFYDKEPSSSTSVGSPSSSQPLSMFFQSLLPTFNSLPNPSSTEPQAANRLNNQDEQNPEHLGEAVAIAAGLQSYRELHNSLTSIVDAMRDFLSNIHMAEAEGENDSSDEYSSDNYD